jgi:hypothetical protein
MQAISDLLRIVLPIAYALVLMNYIGLFCARSLARRLATSGLASRSACALSLILRGLSQHRHPIASSLRR